MMAMLSRFLDRFSEFYAHRKGLLPLVGMALIIANFILQIVSAGWLAQTNFCLHLGLLLAIVGFMLAWAL